jgi:Tol biopolymer transport system component
MSMIGKSLAHYSIISQIGKGGMGEVYQAKDQKLGREVAIKVLPEEFARDHDRVARFQREAKLLASLNHPNIASIYGLEESDGTNFLVMELIEGETLAERISGSAGVLAGKNAAGTAVPGILKIALQIAEALEAAHEKGVIHRDLKPANIKVTPEGKVKVLDFGLAKAYAGDPADPNLSNSPTLSDAATMQGVILGTAAYMSPEQARGKPVDRRADVWAFGVVLYEMLTGKSAFSGRDVTDTLAAVIRSEPEWDSLPANLHWRLREVLERCLEKEAKDRYGVISDARVDIQKVLSDPGGVFSQSIQAVKLRKKMQVGIPWVAVTAILCLIIAAVAVWFFKPAEPKRVMRLEYGIPEGRQFSRNLSGAVQYQIAVSPDGSRFVYNTTDGLYMRSMDALDAGQIAGTDKTSMQPFFSPDGRWIGYFSLSDQKLKKVSTSGGAPVVLCDVGIGAGASWDSDDTIVYSDVGSGIMRVSANGGTPETLVKGSLADLTKAGFPIMPQMLPDGDTLLFTNVFSSGIADYQIAAQSLQSGERKVLFKGGADARYLPTGHIVYFLTDNNRNNLLSVPFDLDSLDLKGGAVPLVEGIASAAVSNTGTLVYIPAAGAGAGSLSTPVWVDRNGKEEPLSAKSDAYKGPRISPDGTRVAFSINKDGSSNIWTWDIVRETITRLTFDEAGVPVWTSDSKRIAFASGREGGSGGVYWKPADGTGETEKLGSEPDLSLAPWSLSGDGKTLVLLETVIGGSAGIDFNIGTMSLEGGHEHKTLLKEKYMEALPKISPDGRWMTYWSNESGESSGGGEIYVRPFPDVDKGKWQVSQGGGVAPLWSPDGRELFYFSGDGVMSVQVESEPTFNAGKPKVLFKGNYVFPSIGDGTPWDIHPKDRRFLMLKPAPLTGEPAALPAPGKIVVVLNWFEELKERAPAR